MSRRLRYFSFACCVCCVCCMSLSLSFAASRGGGAPVADDARAQAGTTQKKGRGTTAATAKKAPAPSAKKASPPATGGQGGGNNPSTKYAGPKLFIGSAFDGATRQLANSPSLVAARAGYHLHPMGFAAAENGGYAKQLLNNFKTKWYFYESDFSAWTDGSNPLQTNTPGVWGDKLNASANGPTEWKCAGFWGYYSNISQVVQDTAGYIQKTKALKEKIRAWGCGSYFVGWAPPSPEGLANDGVLRTRKTMFSIAKAVGATGIFVDFPADLWNNGTCKQQAIDAYKDCASAGMSFGWCFNGRQSTAAVTQAVQGILAAGIKPTFWSVDGFYEELTGKQLSDQLAAIASAAKV